MSISSKRPRRDENSVGRPDSIVRPSLLEPGNRLETRWHHSTGSRESGYNYAWRRVCARYARVYLTKTVGERRRGLTRREEPMARGWLEREGWGGRSREKQDRRGLNGTREDGARRRSEWTFNHGLNTTERMRREGTKRGTEASR